jgi:ribonuclease MRP protein subunit SNM1
MAKSRSEKLQAAFLEKSSYTLAVSAPSTSAYLMTERLALMPENDREPTKFPRHEMCRACGTVTTLGWTATTARRTGSTKQQHRGRRERKIIQVCLVCHRETVNALPIVPKAAKRSQTQSIEPVSSKIELGTPPTVNDIAEKTSSKRRAKTRKEKSGLQALLNKNKQSPNPSPTLDLMDFMKP